LLRGLHNEALRRIADKIKRVAGNERQRRHTSIFQHTDLLLVT